MEKDQSFITDDVEKQGWTLLEKSIAYYQNRPVGTLAICSKSPNVLNFDYCFVRDFVPSALLFLIKGRYDIVRYFLEETLKLQPTEKQFDAYTPSKGLIPASFKIVSDNGEEHLEADFGEQAIARVTPVDSCLWWVIILHAYVKATKDINFALQPQFQQGISLIMELCLATRFDMYPTLLVPDGACMIYRRLGIYGYPIEIQTLFYAALRAARKLLICAGDEEIVIGIDNRLPLLRNHIREHYWIDINRLNKIHRFKVEEYGETAVNQFNIYADSVPYSDLSSWLPFNGGYLAGNVGPSQLDTRFFSLGNLMAIITSLTTEKQSQAIMNLIEEQWEDLVGQMPMKICFPALEKEEYRIFTGADPKNLPWSNHNGGNWPVLIWFLTAAAQKTGRSDIGKRAIELAQARLSEDEWPEYYDGTRGILIGKGARRYQTWTISGFLLAKELMRNPEHLELISFGEYDSDNTSLVCDL
ncbi:glycoside hydrolase 100 family protein [Cronbergia sp. UHCC 0137]|uniref:glycoside hydrolase 100 family protein n=1 Tax=Cronbergia sp. UHCC 0137 TaxID=3110239 RepID=UPI002B211F9B|nr:glycoside hydrolase 100 family protein [Cronbergia sp. UHCC 0137]MEA5619575.1 glycoside hydrolase 100 family protein [Cronbergia sp. UHCC 0137]